MIPRPWLNDEPACLYPQVESQVSVFHSDWICQMRSTRIQTEMKEFRRLDKLDLHKFTAAILNFQASPPQFKRCLRGLESVRAWHCPSIFGMLKYLLWPTYFALATEFFLHSFPVSITDDELPARNYRRTLKAPIQDQLQSCTRFFAGICQHSPHNLS